ncbi:MAG: phosphoribosylamine--glycine ligase [Oscillibacter sp.]
MRLFHLSKEEFLHEAMVIGGGREHAIIKKLKENPAVEKFTVCLATAASRRRGLRLGDRREGHPRAGRICWRTALIMPSSRPTTPSPSARSTLSAAGIPCFGPTKAVIEASKAFAKDLMQKYNIPTAKYRVFTDAPSACAYIDAEGAPIVVKADGLALGKGVVVAQTVEEAKAAVRAMIEDKTFGQSGARVVIEEYMEGPEVSVLSFTDGETLVPMVSSMDHKRALDGDKGPPHRQHGAVAPNPYYTKELVAECMENIFLPTIRAMRAEGRPSALPLLRADAHQERPEGWSITAASATPKRRRCCRCSKATCSPSCRRRRTVRSRM